MGEGAEDDSGYQMTMPFVTVTERGGPHETGAYVAGFEMGSLDQQLKLNPAESGQTFMLHAENQPQADLIAMRRGYRMEVVRKHEGGWIEVRMTLALDTLTL
jgi:hypothetical protein